MIRCTEEWVGSPQDVDVGETRRETLHPEVDILPLELLERVFRFQDARRRDAREMQWDFLHRHSEHTYVER
jgi:hypothetical protein